MVVPGDLSWAGRVWEATDVGWCLRAVLAGGLGSEAWVVRRLACGGGWDFKRGRERRPRAWRTRSFAWYRYQTSPQG